MLRVSNLNVFYGDAQALWDLSIEVPDNSIVALVGSNGAGKSTTLRSISNLMPAQSGDITIDGVGTIGLPAHKIVELGVAHVPEGRQLFPMMTVGENLRVGSVLNGAKGNRQETLDEVFELFPRLKERQDQLAQTLSGGEQQMLAIGRGLMLRPKLILLDEPSLGLAPLVVDLIFQIVREIKNKGITVLLVEQNVQQSLELADRGYVLENGRIVSSGPGKELLADGHIKEAYLGI